jgi:hypothetical protein
MATASRAARSLSAGGAQASPGRDTGATSDGRDARDTRVPPSRSPARVAASPSPLRGPRGGAASAPSARASPSSRSPARVGGGFGYSPGRGTVSQVAGGAGGGGAGAGGVGTAARSATPAGGRPGGGATTTSPGRAGAGGGGRQQPTRGGSVVVAGGSGGVSARPPWVSDSRVRDELSVLARPVRGLSSPPLTSPPVTSTLLGTRSGAAAAGGGGGGGGTSSATLDAAGGVEDTRSPTGPDGRPESPMSTLSPFSLGSTGSNDSDRGSSTRATNAGGDGIAVRITHLGSASGGTAEVAEVAVGPDVGQPQPGGVPARAVEVVDAAAGGAGSPFSADDRVAGLAFAGVEAWLSSSGSGSGGGGSGGVAGEVGAQAGALGDGGSALAATPQDVYNARYRAHLAALLAGSRSLGPRPRSSEASAGASAPAQPVPPVGMGAGAPAAPDAPVAPAATTASTSTSQVFMGNGAISAAAAQSGSDRGALGGSRVTAVSPPTAPGDASADVRLLATTADGASPLPPHHRDGHDAGTGIVSSAIPSTVDGAAHPRAAAVNAPTPAPSEWRSAGGELFAADASRSSANAVPADPAGGAWFVPLHAVAPAESGSSKPAAHRGVPVDPGAADVPLGELFDRRPGRGASRDAASTAAPTAAPAAAPAAASDPAIGGNPDVPGEWLWSAVSSTWVWHPYPARSDAGYAAVPTHGLGQGHGRGHDAPVPLRPQSFTRTSHALTDSFVAGAGGDTGFDGGAGWVWPGPWEADPFHTRVTGHHSAVPPALPPHTHGAAAVDTSHQRSRSMSRSLPRSVSPGRSRSRQRSRRLRRDGAPLVPVRGHSRSLSRSLSPAGSRSRSRSRARSRSRSRSQLPQQRRGTARARSLATEDTVVGPQGMPRAWAPPSIQPSAGSAAPPPPPLTRRSRRRRSRAEVDRRLSRARQAAAGDAGAASMKVVGFEASLRSSISAGGAATSRGAGTGAAPRRRGAAGPQGQGRERRPGREVATVRLAGASAPSPALGSGSTHVAQPPLGRVTVSRPQGVSRPADDSLSASTLDSDRAHAQRRRRPGGAGPAEAPLGARALRGGPGGGASTSDLGDDPGTDGGDPEVSWDVSFGSWPVEPPTAGAWGAVSPPLSAARAPRPTSAGGGGHGDAVTRGRAVGRAVPDGTRSGGGPTRGASASLGRASTASSAGGSDSDGGLWRVGSAVRRVGAPRPRAGATASTGSGSGSVRSARSARSVSVGSSGDGWGEPAWVDVSGRGSLSPLPRSRRARSRLASESEGEVRVRTRAVQQAMEWRRAAAVAARAAGAAGLSAPPASSTVELSSQSSEFQVRGEGGGGWSGQGYHAFSQHPRCSFLTAL